MLEEFNQILQSPVVVDAIQYVNLYAPYAILLASLYFSTRFVISFLKTIFEVVKRVPSVVGWVAKQAWGGVKLVGRGVAAVGRGVKNSFKWLFGLGGPKSRVIWDDSGKNTVVNDDNSGLVCWGHFNFDEQWLDDNHPNRNQYRDLGDKVRSQMKSPEHYMGLLKELYDGEQRKDARGAGTRKPFTGRGTSPFINGRDAAYDFESCRILASEEKKAESKEKEEENEALYAAHGYAESEPPPGMNAGLPVEPERPKEWADLDAAYEPQSVEELKEKKDEKPVETSRTRKPMNSRSIEVLKHASKIPSNFDETKDTSFYFDFVHKLLTFYGVVPTMREVYEAHEAFMCQIEQIDDDPFVLSTIENYKPVFTLAGGWGIVRIDKKNERISLVSYTVRDFHCLWSHADKVYDVNKEVFNEKPEQPSKEQVKNADMEAVRNEINKALEVFYGINPWQPKQKLTGNPFKWINRNVGRRFT